MPGQGAPRHDGAQIWNDPGFRRSIGKTTTIMTTNAFETIVGRLSGIPAPAVDIPARRRHPGARAEPVRWSLPGLCGSARITTSFGDLPVEALRRRDPLRTRDGGLRMVEWVDHIRLDEDFLAENPDAVPVRIAAGTFGPGRPERDLVVSPQQAVNASPTPFAQEFRRARDLLGRPGVVRQPATMVSYHLFHCGTPTLVMAEGVCLSVTP